MGMQRNLVACCQCANCAKCHNSPRVSILQPVKAKAEAIILSGCNSIHGSNANGVAEGWISDTTCTGAKRHHNGPEQRKTQNE